MSWLSCIHGIPGDVTRTLKGKASPHHTNVVTIFTTDKRSALQPSEGNFVLGL